MTRARKLWTAAAVVAVLAMTAYLFVSLTYQLEHGDTWNVGEGAVFEKNAPDVALHQLRAGYEVQIVITVRNPGPLTVALDEVSFSGADIVIDDVTMIERAGQDPRRCCLPEHAEPFHPSQTRVRPSGDGVVGIAGHVSKSVPAVRRLHDREHQHPLRRHGS